MFARSADLANFYPPAFFVAHKLVYIPSAHCIPSVLRS
ncbi:hypothetical protein SF123566_2029 [Shigella flexneri 1235-66]|nr:hypothetical protein SF123566_2029 [Shigella flexneri 1235-66]